MPDQIREKHHRAAQERDDDGFAPAKIALDFTRQNFDAPRDLFFGDENALDFLAPARRNGSFEFQVFGFSGGHAIAGLPLENFLRQSFAARASRLRVCCSRFLPA
jgi:hypothetical protein